MTKIYCGDASCKFCNNHGVCTQKTVCLGWSSVMTAHDGRQEYHRCKTYEISERAKEINAFFDRIRECEQT